MQSNEQRWFEALEGDVEPWELDSFRDTHERANAFAYDATFGTGGIRALMGIGPNRLNKLTVSRATAGLAKHLQEVCDHVPLVAIAYDTRVHSRDFALTAARVLAAYGAKVVVFAEHQPTPVLCYAVRWLGADAGIVLTASHNPMEYNGFKVYGSKGDQATDELAHAVQACIAQIDPFHVRTTSFDEGLQSGAISWAPQELLTDYVRTVVNQSTGVDCGSVKLAYSPLNGTGLVPVQRVCEIRGIDCRVVEEQREPDGTFPTCPKPNPEHAPAMADVMELALREGCDLAVANDPDADRIGVAVPHEGTMRLLSGDEVGLLLFDFLARAIPHEGNAIAATTIVSTPLHDSIASANGVKLRRTLTGFKYIGEQINLLEAQGRSSDFLLGMEESCGYLRGTYVRDKDGVVSLMLICELTAYHKERGRDLVQALDSLYECYGHMVARQVAAELPGTEGREAITRILAGLRSEPPKDIGGLAVKKTTDYAQGAPMPGDASQTLPQANVIEFDLEHNCKLIVRPSGTEPKVKAYCFAGGSTAQQAKERLQSIVDAAQHMLHA